MSKFDDQYIDLCRRILSQGEKIQNYKKTDTRSSAVATSITDHAAQASQETKTSYCLLCRNTFYRILYIIN